ncbi:hypothetical protein MHYP_G00156930 [Metynnis hypsauchen]
MFVAEEEMPQQIHPIWSLESFSSMSRNFLSKNDELRKGDYLKSNNGEYKAVFQEDSNFVVYAWKPVWASDTWDANAHRLCMQGDCNLVMYTKDGKAKWHTNTNRKGEHERCRLYLCDDGKLVLDGDGEQLWSSSNSKGTK